MIAVYAPSRQFVALGKALKDAGNKDLKKDLNKRIKKAAQPVVKSQRGRVKQLSSAPSEWRKSASRRTRVKADLKTKKRAGVRIITAPVKGEGAYARYMNRGKWRHPVFGDRENWVTQHVQPRGWFDDPARFARQSVTKEVIKAMSDTVAEIARRGA